ncbi:MAG: NAD(P)/FAD-dependent oxidoreductase [Ignavibacteriales bacterium]|nr:MAG: NAD(P)/FAD-dependent oxidoreductase [Ignavibacteriales bacterium]
MTDNYSFEVIIIGGSYAGLSAGMALGRALRKALIIDSGKPCNIQTPHSHNFITQDGRTPGEISSAARAQVEKYNSIQFYSGTAVSGTKTEKGFEVKTQSGDSFTAKKLIFATGVKDIMPAIKGFAECWGISVIHCPYCHGYEVRNEKTGILGNGDIIFEFSKLINHWTKDLTLFTNGKSKLTNEQTEKLKQHNIKIVETEIDIFEQSNGQIENVVFKDASKISMKAVYAKIPFEQHCDIPKQLGCELNEGGYIKIDPFQKTTIPGVFACGDNVFVMRSVANAVAMGTLTGAMVNKEIIDEEF